MIATYPVVVILHCEAERRIHTQAELHLVFEFGDPIEIWYKGIETTVVLITGQGYRTEYIG